MCLITRQKEPIILTEDKIVCKLLTHSLESPYSDFSYEIGKLYETEIIKDVLFESFYDRRARMNYIKESIYNETMRRRAQDMMNIGEIISISRGFHSFVTFERIREGIYYHIYEAIVPAGSEYYEDETLLCVSNKIIINKLLS